MANKVHKLVANPIEESTAGVYLRIPSTALVSSPYNMRKKPRTLENIKQLAALIRARGGVVQNLIVYPISKKNKPTGKYGVCAGEGRRLALNWLKDNGEFIDYEAPCLLVTEEEAISMSMTENAGREPIHPADEFEAFRRLVIEQEKSIEDVAAAFGVTPVVVQRRLRLANLAPCFVEKYRNDEDRVSLETLMALSIVDDHQRQIEIWDSLPPYNRNAHNIRQLATQGELRADNRLVQFIGIEAYEQAGGSIRRDLFSDNGEGYLTDAVLVETLAQEKLQIAAEELENIEGVAWIEIHTNISFSELSAYGRIPKFERDLTPEESNAYQALLDESDTLGEQIDNYDGEGDEDEYAALESKFETLHKNIEKMQEEFLVPDPAYKGLAGVIVTIDNSGEILIHRGLIRPEDKQTAAKTAREEKKNNPESEGQFVHSERLTRQLTAHRTVAMQEALTSKPFVALAAITAKLVDSVFGTFEDSVLQVRVEHTNLKNFAPDITESRAMKSLMEKHEKWANKLTEAGETSLLEWLLAQPQELIIELLAFCMAQSLNTVQHSEITRAEIGILAKALGLNMADWWCATSDSYLSHVSKSRILSVLDEAGVAEGIANLSTLKKVELAKTAEERLKDCRWLPEVMRFA